MDLTFGVTFHLEKKKKPFAVANVYYDKRGHLIEFVDPEDTTKVIKGLVPVYPADAQTPTEPEDKPEPKKENSGIG